MIQPNVKTIEFVTYICICIIEKKKKNSKIYEKNMLYLFSKIVLYSFFFSFLFLRKRKWRKVVTEVIDGIVFLISDAYQYALLLLYFCYVCSIDIIMAVSFNWSINCSLFILFSFFTILLFFAISFLLIILIINFS